MAAVSVVVGVTNRARPVDRGAVPVTVSVPPRAAASAPPSAATTVPPGSFPTGVDIGQLGVRAEVVPVAVAAGGALVVPDDVRTVGWWAGGAEPGAATGTVVLDGHVDSAAAGAGALFDVRRIEVGAVVVVTGVPHDVSYRITGLREYDKGDLPAASLFVRSGRPRLVLITCGGPFDPVTRHYRDNIVAFGVPFAQ